MNADFVTVESTAHLALTEDVLAILGAAPDVAREQAEQLLEGDLRGHASHGLRRLAILADRIRNGLIDPAAHPTLEWRTNAFLVLDGRQGFGTLAAKTAIAQLIERVATTGVAVAAIHDANHLGMLAPYVERIAAKRMIGIATTTSEALVHAWGGRHAMVGTNPLAIAIPTGGDPVVLDMATGQVSMGKVLDFAARGVALPPGWAVDADGAPTTDARAAISGAISPFGGAKGYALGVTLEMLVASLTNTALGPDVRGTLDAEHLCNKGDVFIVLDTVRHGSATASLDAYLAALRNSEPAEGHHAVEIPGDRARRVRAQRLARGVPVPVVTWQMAQALSESLRSVAPRVAFARDHVPPRRRSATPTVESGPPTQTQRRLASILRPESLPARDRGTGARTVHLVTTDLGSRRILNGITTFEPGGEVALHVHNCAESVVVLEGEAVVEVDGSEHRLSRFDTTYVGSGVEHRFWNPSSDSLLRIFWTYDSTNATRTVVATGVTSRVDVE